MGLGEAHYKSICANRPLEMLRAMCYPAALAPDASRGERLQNEDAKIIKSREAHLHWSEATQRDVVSRHANGHRISGTGYRIEDMQTDIHKTCKRTFTKTCKRTCKKQQTAEPEVRLAVCCCIQKISKAQRAVTTSIQHVVPCAIYT